MQKSSPTEQGPEPCSSLDVSPGSTSILCLSGAHARDTQALCQESQDSPPVKTAVRGTAGDGRKCF